MRGKVVTIIVLVASICYGSLAALAQPAPLPADGPQRAGSRDRHGTLYGPASRQGGSLERWPRPRRAHSDSHTTVSSCHRVTVPPCPNGPYPMHRLGQRLGLLDPQPHQIYLKLVAWSLFTPRLQ
jgi:hypothetical protein